MKTESVKASTLVPKRKQASGPKQTLQTLIRLFRFNDFRTPRVSQDGVCFILNCSSLLPTPAATFPLMFSVMKVQINLRIYFSMHSAAYSIKDPALEKRISLFLSLANRTFSFGQFLIEPAKKLVYFNHSLPISSRSGSTLEESIRLFTNSSVELFKPFAHGLFDMVTKEEIEDPQVVVERCRGMKEHLTFLKPRENTSTNDSDSALLLGLKCIPSCLMEVNLEAENQLKAWLKPLKSYSLFLWDSLETDSDSASVQFCQPKNCFSFPFFISQMNGNRKAVLEDLQRALDTLSSERISIENLYERLYVQRTESGDRIMINPAVLNDSLECRENGYLEVWRKIVDAGIQGMNRSAEKLSHDDIWNHLDPLWKLSPNALFPGVDGTYTLGSQFVHLEELRLLDTARATVDFLISELTDKTGPRRYGVTAVQRRDRDGVVCYIVKEGV